MIERWVVEALSHGAVIYDPFYVLCALLLGDLHLWLAVNGNDIRACAITRLGAYPRLRVVEFLIVGGADMHAWLPLSSQIAERARNDCGAQAFEAPGRLGWTRAARRYGFNRAVTVYRKVL